MPKQTGKSVTTFVGPAVGALLLVLVLILRPEEIRSVLRSPRAVLILVGTTAAWIVLSRFVLPRVLPNPWARAAVLAVPAVLIVWVWVVPYFRNVTVNEEFPVTVGAAPATTTPATNPATTGAASAVTGAPPTTSAPAPAGPVRLSVGTMAGIDHRVSSGEAAIFRQPDGTYVIRIENLDMQSGPDLRLYLAPDFDQKSLDGSIEIAALKGNRGNQTYEVPAGVDAPAFRTVLVWCRAFAVPFANASQTTG